MAYKIKRMGKFGYLRFNKRKEGDQDFLRIKGGVRFSITGSLRTLEFIDKDTNQFVSYMPSLELSGYGQTKAKAIQMLKNSIDSTFEMWTKLSIKDLHRELGALGWKQNTFKHKEYSNSFVDQHGNLKGIEVINAVDNKYEVGHLTVA